MKTATNAIFVFVVGIISFLLLYSCAKENFDFDKFSGDAMWNPNLAVPVAFGNLTMEDMLPEKEDTVVYYADTLPDGTALDNPGEKKIKLVYIIDSMFPIDDYMKLPTIETYSTSIKLNALVLEDFNGNETKTFSELLYDNFDVPDQTYYEDKIITNNPEDYTVKNANNNEAYRLPNHDAIEWAYFSNGSIEIKAHNTFTVPVRFIYNLYTIYLGNRTLVSSFDFTKDTTTLAPIWINPGETVSRFVNLNNKLVASILEYELENLSFGSAIGVLLDPADSLILDISITDIEATSGRAFLPKQLLNIDTTQYFTVTEANKNKQLFHIDVKKGILNYEMTTNINTGVSIELTLPTVTNGSGNPAYNKVTLNSSGTSYNNFDLSGYSMDLTQNQNQYYNSMPANLKISISSKNNTDFIEFDASDSVAVTLVNTDSLEFEYIGGFYDFDTIAIENDSISFGVDNFLSDYFEGEIVFTNPQLALNFDNAMGVKGMMDLSMTGYDKNRDSVKLFDVGDNIFAIDGPDDRYGIIPTKNNIVIDKETSNIVDFFSLLPSSLHYRGEILMNRIYNEQTKSYTLVDTTGLSANPYDINFITDNGQASLGIEAALPLEFYMKNLILRQDFQIGILEDVSDIEQLRIYFNTKNGFPLDVKLNVIMLDTTLPESQQVLGLLDMFIVDKASADSRGKVARGDYTEHEEELILSKDNGDLLLDNFMRMNKLRIEATLNTDQSDLNKSISIYNYYGVEFIMALDAKFAYKFNISKSK